MSEEMSRTGSALGYKRVIAVANMPDTVLLDSDAEAAIHHKLSFLLKTVSAGHGAENPECKFTKVHVWRRRGQKGLQVKSPA